MEYNWRTVGVVRLLRVEVTGSTVGLQDAATGAPDAVEYVPRRYTTLTVAVQSTRVHRQPRYLHHHHQHHHHKFTITVIIISLSRIHSLQALASACVWLQLRIDRNSTAVRLLFDCNSSALRPCALCFGCCTVALINKYNKL